MAVISSQRSSFPCYLIDLWPGSKRCIKRVVPVERQLGCGCAGRNPQRRSLTKRPVRLTSLDGLYSPHGPLLSCDVTQTVDRVSVAETKIKFSEWFYYCVVRYTSEYWTWIWEWDEFLAHRIETYLPVKSFLKFQNFGVWKYLGWFDQYEKVWQILATKFLENAYGTRMHSSRMRTAHSLTASRSFQGGVHGGGGGGHAWQGGACMVGGGMCGRGACVAHIPPVDRILDTRLWKTLPSRNFVAGGNYTSSSQPFWRELEFNLKLIKTWCKWAVTCLFTFFVFPARTSVAADARLSVPAASRTSLTSFAFGWTPDGEHRAKIN